VRHPESLRVQAYFDGEVDAIGVADIERHIEQCDECRALLQDLERTRATLRRDLTYFNAPGELRARLNRALDRESASGSSRRNKWGPSAWRVRPFWLGAASGGFATAIAAILAFVIWAPTFTNPLVDDLMSAHVRSLMSTHLIDVVSTDKHTVKPWFAGHADVSPVVADFEPQGYRLMGGRADYVDHQRAAVVIYQHGQHVINVFSWAADQRFVPKNMTRSGYHLVFWRSGDLENCAVSDTSWDELLGLVRLLRGESNRSRE
jgi:anti-sigma factor RsiW